MNLLLLSDKLSVPPSANTLLTEGSVALLTEGGNELLLDEVIITPTILTEVYAEDYGTGLPTSFAPTVGPTLTKTGSPGYALRAAELGSRGIIDINSTGQYFNWASALSADKLNYAIFTVTRQSGTTSGGNTVDFRGASGYNLILPAYNTANDQNGWYYGQTSGIKDITAITGESQTEFYIRCWLLEDNVARLYIQGGIVDKQGVFEDTALNETLKLGGTSSTSLDIELANVSIYSLPLGEKFKASFLDEKGNALQAYYAGGASPEAIWNSITV